MDGQNLILVGSIADIKEDALNEFIVNDMSLLVFRRNNNYYVLNSTCPHRGGNLSKGILKDNCVQCPLHHAEFDITTGKMLKGPQITSIGIIDNVLKAVLPKPQTYQTVVKEKQLYIKGPVIKQKTMA